MSGKINNISKNTNNDENKNPADELILENNHQSNRNTENQSKKKSDRIIDILMNIKSCSDTSSILMKIFGNDLIDRIISPNSDEELLNEIENTIFEINSFKEKNSIPSMNNQQFNKNSNKSNNKIIDSNGNGNNSEHENHNQKFKKIPNYNSNINHIRQPSNFSVNKSELENIILQRNYSTKNNNTASNRGLKRSNSKSTLNISRNSRSKSKLDFFEEGSGSDTRFENMLRKYGEKSIDSKVFMNYSKKKGNFFDPTLQKGGNSSLDIKDHVRKRSNSRKMAIQNNLGNNFSNYQF